MQSEEQAEDIEGASGSESMERRNCLYPNSMLRLKASLAGFSFKSFALVKITYTETITWGGNNDKNVSYNFS